MIAAVAITLALISIALSIRSLMYGHAVQLYGEAGVQYRAGNDLGADELHRRANRLHYWPKRVDL